MAHSLNNIQRAKISNGWIQTKEVTKSNHKSLANIYLNFEIYENLPVVIYELQFSVLPVMQHKILVSNKIV